MEVWIGTWNWKDCSKDRNAIRGKDCSKDRNVIWGKDCSKDRNAIRGKDCSKDRNAIWCKVQQGEERHPGQGEEEERSPQGVANQKHCYWKKREATKRSEARKGQPVKGAALGRGRVI